VELFEDSSSEEHDSGEYEWDGPPGNQFFPDLDPHPVGRWVRTKNVSSPPLAPPALRSLESDSDEVYVTLPPGPYVPPWLQVQEEVDEPEDKEELDDHDDGAEEVGERRSTGGGVHTQDGGVKYASVRDYFLAQREDDAAAVQLSAQQEHEREYNTTVASLASSRATIDPREAHQLEGGYAERDLAGSGREYGKTSMQSKSMRRLDLHRKDHY